MAAVITLKPLAATVGLTTTTAAAIADFDTVFTASQIATIGLRLRIDLPAGGGGVKLNWRVPTTTWPFAGQEVAWSYELVGGDGSRFGLGNVPLADPSRDNFLGIPSQGAALSLYLSAKHAFKAPAAGGTLRLFAALLSPSGLTTNLVLDTVNGIPSYAETILQ